MLRGTCMAATLTIADQSVIKQHAFSCFDRRAIVVQSMRDIDSRIADRVDPSIVRRIHGGQIVRHIVIAGAVHGHAYDRDSLCSSALALA